MNTETRWSGRVATGVAFAIGLMSFLPDAASANPNGRPDHTQLGQGSTLNIDEVTPFSVRLFWTTGTAYSQYTVSRSGGDEPGRIQSYAGNPRRRDSANINRLRPETTYDFEVRALSQRRWVFIASAKVTTKAAQRVPVGDGCDYAEVSLRRLTSSQAEIDIQAACEFSELTLALIPLDGGVRELIPINLLRPTRVFRYTFTGLDPDRAYRIRVARMDGENPSPLGNPILFRTP